MTRPVPKVAYTIDEAAYALGLSRRTIYKRIASGELRAKNVFGRTIIAAADVEQVVVAAPAKDDAA
jgi:excisionase family DNA binding protein